MHISQSKRCHNVIPSVHYFYAYFQIYISASLRSLLFYFAMDRRKLFNELVEYYRNIFPHYKPKEQVAVANEWKNMKVIKDNVEFINVVLSIKRIERSSTRRGEKKHEQIFHGCQKRKTCNSFCWHILCCWDQHLESFIKWCDTTDFH